MKILRSVICNKRKDGSFAYRVYIQEKFPDGTKYVTRQDRHILPQGWGLEKESTWDVVKRLTDKGTWTALCVLALGVCVLVINFEEKNKEVSSFIGFTALVGVGPSAIKEIPSFTSKIIELARKGKRFKPVQLPKS